MHPSDGSCHGRQRGLDVEFCLCQGPRHVRIQESIVVGRLPKASFPAAVRTVEGRIDLGGRLAVGLLGLAQCRRNVYGLLARLDLWRLDVQRGYVDGGSRGGGRHVRGSLLAGAEGREGGLCAVVGLRGWRVFGRHGGRSLGEGRVRGGGVVRAQSDFKGS